jgi:2-oxo-4-hydroxy-4-carboxy--5-ureidoimidazoline (OHCU) decarboxylase
MDATPATPRLLPIAELNRVPQEAFAEALKPLFEAAPPLATGLFAARPYRSYDELLDRAAALIDRLTDAQKVAVVNAHPRIGESAGAVRRTSVLSYREQGYDQESTLDPAELERIYRQLAELNRAYEERFGFRFVVFVNGRPKSVIAGVLRERLERPRAEEVATALSEMLAIARDRLAKLSVER